MRRLLPLIALPLLALAAPDKAPGVSASFRALSFSGTIPDAAYATGEDERVPLLISADFFTTEQHYHGPANLRFTHLAKDLSEKPLAETTIADGARVILLFVPDGNGGQAIRVLRDVAGDFPWGTLRFVNLTGGRVRILAGNRTFTMDNGADQVVRPAAGNKQYAMTEIQTEREDGFARGYMLRTFQEDDLRGLYFLLPADPKEHNVTLKAVEERKGDEKNPPPAPKPVSLKPKPGNGKVNGSGKPATR